ncbi:MAG TPA: DsbA family protein [Acidimicrobiales bacterium]|nr:DsbA family protein [Acidimicrobiales bacterium]
MGAGETSTGATFYFDPGCPWTWMTSRWLVAAARERSLDIRGRTFSLALLNEDRPLPPFLDTSEMRAKMALAARALRVVDAAVTQGDNDAAARFYTEFGTRFHESDQPPSDEMLDAAVEAADVGDLVSSADDSKLDAAAAESLAEARRLAGPDIGSPVLHLYGAERGTFGPIVSPPPVGEEAGRLWDAVVGLQEIGSFYELKRGRTDPPQFHP